MPKKPIKKDELAKIYQENNADNAAKKLGISITSLYFYLKENGIPLKGRGGKRQRRKLWIVG